MENSEARKRKEEVDCHHIFGGFVPNEANAYQYMDFIFCPKCGEKL